MSKKTHGNHIQPVVGNGERKQITVSTFTGPLPPPEILHHYDEISPGLADRIVALAEREAAHRHTIEISAVTADREDSRRMFLERRLGQVLATLIGLSGMGGGVFTVVQGYSVAGTAIVTVSLGTLAVAFLRGRKIR